QCRWIAHADKGSRFAGIVYPRRARLCLRLFQAAPFSIVQCDVLSDHLDRPAERSRGCDIRLGRTQIGLIVALQLSGPQSATVTTYQGLMLVLAFTGLAIGGLVTERRRFEHELRLNQESVTHIFRLGSAGELTTAIAHEINQPLTAISNYARFI